MITDRKSSYKLPPTTIRDKLVSQEARRAKALEEQKRRRAQKIDSARQLDLFADLTLGASDDEDADANPPQNARPAPGSIAQYAAMLSSGYQDSTPTPFTFSPPLSTENPPISIPEIQVPPDSAIQQPEPEQAKPRSPKKKRGGASKQKRRSNKSSKWADKCMYAELLEMTPDEPWDRGDGSDGESNDGLPKDLESAWVAVAPVPAGKRCLAVSHTSAGVSGLVPNTTLRSRLLGKTLLPRFPSILPPLTVLDCILDKQWRENGIVHVLDVIKWKGQDVGDCEAGFRFWWRDTRLAELGQPIQLEPQTFDPAPSSASGFGSTPTPGSSSSSTAQKYTFPYPTSFIPVPYHTNTTLTSLDVQVIPAAKSWRSFSVPLPMQLRFPGSAQEASTNGPPDSGMDILPIPSMSIASSSKTHFPPHTHSTQSSFTVPASTSMPARIEPDGMLLYVSEASYEPGTSPLSSWIPIQSYDNLAEKEIADGVVDGRARTTSADTTAARRIVGNNSEGPLNLFQRQAGEEAIAASAETCSNRGGHGRWSRS
ncbi:hypothetical protein CPB84DRAFT_1855294 [Gymnopilus junonius]|uniref:Snurportin-1 n=1 Tax=Gymnopilus junonius TaxID=109634 RepID=A0A9P5N8I8_GYMJU|nr:hypothetical protein CPB84DRAFT_1855294 [Gymnopilus junonius]